jgi:hypothetical protein
MRPWRQSGGLGWYFRPGRPGIGTVLVSIWAGFMVATAGAALYPPVTAIVTPLVCPGQAETESQTYATRPGETIVTREYLCTAPGGKPESIMFKTLAATGAAYALIAFVLLTLVGLWRGRGGRAAAAASPATTPHVFGSASRPDHYPADPLADFLTRPDLQPRAPDDESDTARRLAEIKRLHASGLIADVDYEAKKAEILSRL